jgi:hypothetical protein
LKTGVRKLTPTSYFGHGGQLLHRLLGGVIKPAACGAVPAANVVGTAIKIPPG